MSGIRRGKELLGSLTQKENIDQTFSGIGKNKGAYRYRRISRRNIRQIKYNSQGIEKTAVSKILNLTIINMNI